MIIDQLTIHFNKYRCFRTKTDFGPIKRANVIIGKNNSGKSALIDVFEMLCLPSNRTHESAELEFEITRPLKEGEKNKIRNTDNGLIKQKGIDFIDSLTFHFVKEGNKYKPVSSNDNQAFRLWERYFDQDNEYTRFNVLRLNADRDIIPEPHKTDDSGWVIPSNGSGITKMIQALLNRSDLNQSIVEDKILSALNEITKPDIDIKRIQTKSDKHASLWEIFFTEDGKDDLIPLSKSGSGLKTIIAMLMFIHGLPEVLKIEIKDVVFAFEELENNLHPSVQRKLYRYLENMSKQLQFSYFITTHSTVALDYYYGKEEASIFEVSRNEFGSKVSALSNNSEVSNLIDDLGQRASEIMQSNCIIWVEGPTDRIYINKWIELLCDDEIKEGLHYSIMFYGGKSLSHLSFQNDMEDSELDSFISMFRINRHSIVVIDSDKSDDEKNVNDTKARIKNEVEKDGGLCWITEGREIENYISADVLSRLGFTDERTNTLDKFSKIYDTLSKNPPNGMTKHLNTKVAFAKLIAPELKETDLKWLCLEERVNEIIHKIKEWNR